VPTNTARALRILAAGVLVAAVAVVALVASARPAPAATLAMVGTDGGAMRFTAIDPLSLARLPGPSVVVHEYHDARSFSPDGSRLAIGMSAPGPFARIGLQILDVAGRTVARSVATGIAAEAVAWVAPQRIVALLASGDVVVVDADSGAIAARHRLPAPRQCGNQPIAIAGDRAVLLLGRAGAARPVRLVVARADGSIRAVTLDGVRVGSRGFACKQTGLAVDPVAGRAYVVAPGLRSPR
jgi:hypothetical protein